MYKIIGADGKEYGPITTEQLRQWIAEGRANTQTKVLLEGTTEWRPLSSFPEFALTASSGPPPMPGLPTAAPTAAAAQTVSGPATGLMGVAILGFVLQIIALIWRLGGASFNASRMPN